MLSKSRPSYTDIWHNCLLLIKKETTNEEFTRWFKPIVPLGYDGQTLRLRVPNENYVFHIEKNCIPFLKPIICSEFGQNTRLKYAVPQVSQVQNESGEDENAPISSYLNRTNTQNIKNPFVIPGVKKIVVDPQLNFDYTFESFVEGECNRLARSAGMAVAVDPGKTPFNPLFIYGDSGLGKTHVAQAIGAEVKKRYPDKNVLYVSCHKFQAQFQNAMLKKEINDFVHFYQMMDVLIIDDIQELAGKPGTQSIFFNIFNHLHLSKKQLILTSDKPPVELKDIEQRLITRFKWGLSVQLFTPDFDTKVKIIRSKCHKLSMPIEDHVVDFLANNINANIREIEGAISSFVANVTLLNKPATIELAKDILKAYVKYSQKEITADSIREVVCDYFGVSAADFASVKRTREIAQARQVAMYLCKMHTNLPLKTIGAAIGGKNHATVVHACKTIQNLMETDKLFAAHIQEIERRLNN